MGLESNRYFLEGLDMLEKKDVTAIKTDLGYVGYQGEFGKGEVLTECVNTRQEVFSLLEKQQEWLSEKKLELLDNGLVEGIFGKILLSEIEYVTSKSIHLSDKEGKGVGFISFNQYDVWFHGDVSFEL
jgi:hypothetical protein